MSQLVQLIVVILIAKLVIVKLRSRASFRRLVITLFFQVPLSVDSLNNGDCFVFDCGRKIFVWLGKESNGKERFNVSLLIVIIIFFFRWVFL